MTKEWFPDYNGHVTIRGYFMKILWVLFSIVLAFSIFPGHASMLTLDSVADEVNTSPPGLSYSLHDEELTMAWGEKNSTGYRINIEQTNISENTLQIYYSLRYPDPEEFNIAHPVYPEDKASIDGSADDIENVEMYEVKNSSTFKDINTPVKIARGDIWTLTLNQAVNSDSLTDANIYITDENDEKLTSVLVLTTDQEIKIIPPDEEMERGSIYTLYVEKELQSSAGNSLLGGYKQSFYIDNGESVSWKKDAPVTMQPVIANQELDLSFQGAGAEETSETEEEINVFPIEIDENNQPFMIRRIEENTSFSPLRSPLSPADS